MKILVLGASGMLGHEMMHSLRQENGVQVWGTLRSAAALRHFPPAMASRFLAGVAADDEDSLVMALQAVRPDVLINCIGFIKQLQGHDDPLQVLPVNAMLPHRLARLCALAGARLVHVSTDCVFSGSKGNYVEADPADALDLYGRSKHMGEVDYPNAITLRTSIIGHELESRHGLLEWFLAQQGQCKGFTRAVFSGLPTVELARVVRDFVLPQPQLHGVYHVSAAPIDKYTLLKLVARVYGKPIDIVADDQLAIDRSLNSSRFTQASGYQAPPWEALVQSMHDSRRIFDRQ